MSFAKIIREMTAHVSRGRVARRLMAAALFAVPAATAWADLVTLTDSNSVVRIDTSSQSGVFDWTIDGVDQLAQHWFWYRVGAAGPESSIDTLFQTNIANTGNALSVEYKDALANPSFSIVVTFTLNGGGLGSGSSDLIEDLTITNLSNSQQTFHFYQYADFDLNGTSTDSLVQALGSPVNSVTQSEGTAALQELVTNANTAPISHHEVGFFPATLITLNDASPTTLNDSNGPVGPGDLTWALQWDFTLAPGDHLDISKDIRIQAIPAPAAPALLALAGLMTFRRRR